MWDRSREFAVRFWWKEGLQRGRREHRRQDRVVEDLAEYPASRTIEGIALRDWAP
jgi:hypothetical protein